MPLGVHFRKMIPGFFNLEKAATGINGGAPGQFESYIYAAAPRTKALPLAEAKPRTAPIAIETQTVMMALPKPIDIRFERPSVSAVCRR